MPGLENWDGGHVYTCTLVVQNVYLTDGLLQSNGTQMQYKLLDLSPDIQSLHSI